MLQTPTFLWEPKKHTLAMFHIQFEGLHRNFEADQIKNPGQSLDHLSEVCWPEAYNSEQGLLRAQVLDTVLRPKAEQTSF